MKNFEIKGIVAINCFKENDQIDVQVCIEPIGNFLEQLKEKVSDDIEEVIESLTLLVTADVDADSYAITPVNFIQLEEYASESEFNDMFNDIVPYGEVAEVEKFVYELLMERQKEGKLWESYI